MISHRLFFQTLYILLLAPSVCASPLKYADRIKAGENISNPTLTLTLTLKKKTSGIENTIKEMDQATAQFMRESTPNLKPGKLREHTDQEKEYLAKKHTMKTDDKQPGLAPHAIDSHSHKKLEPQDAGPLKANNKNNHKISSPEKGPERGDRLSPDLNKRSGPINFPRK